MVACLRDTPDYVMCMRDQTPLDTPYVRLAAPKLGNLGVKLKPGFVQPEP